MYPILFSFGPITLHTFGIFLALSFVFASFVAWHFGRKEIPEETILDFILISTLIAFFSGRVLFIIGNPSMFGGHLLRMLHIFNYPGFSFTLGIIVGIVGGIAFILRRKLSPWLLLDVSALGLTLGISIGEIGCLLNGCVIGKETNLPWGVSFLGSLGKKHPLSAYEAIITLCMFILLVKLFKKEENIRKFTSPKEKMKSSNGKIGAMFLLLFSLTHFLLEFFREGSVYWGMLKINQIIYLVLFGISLVFLTRYVEIKKIQDIKNLILKECKIILSKGIKNV